MLKVIKIWWKQLFCSHKEWTMDTQITTIECNSCKLQARVKEYKSLFK